MNWELTQEGIGNYLKVASEEREDFADELFSYREIPGFLPLEIRRINGRKEAFYDITGAVPLGRYLAEHTFTLPDIQNILLQIFDLEELLGEYLLEETGLVVHPDFLYIKKADKKIQGIYNGQKCDGGVSAFGELLEYLMEYMNQKDRELVFFVYGMHKLTKGAACTCKELRDYVKNCGGEPEKTAPVQTEGEMEAAQLPARSGTMAVDKQRFHSKKKPVMAGKEQTGAPLQEKRLLWPLLLIPTGVMIPVVMWKMGLFTSPLSGELNIEKCVGAFVFFLVVCGYGAWKLLLLKSNGQADISVQEDEDGEMVRLCLIPGRSGEMVIPAGRFPFLIGGDEERVDTCLDGGCVSDIHVQFIRDCGEIYAIDQETQGGTYHNGSRMVPWQKEALCDGDLLTIGTHEYVVEITCL